MPERGRALAEHPYLFVAASLALCAVAAVAGYGTGIEGLQAVTRYTGRAGLLWFSIIFLLAASHRFRGGAATRDALRITVAFGIHHTVHLALLLAYVWGSASGLDVSRAAGGMLGYVLLFAMMATSRSAEDAGPFRYRALHELGLWYLWVVFALTYVPRLAGKLPNVGGGRNEFLACMTLVVVIATVRLGAFVNAKIRTHPHAPAP